MMSESSTLPPLATGTLAAAEATTSSSSPSLVHVNNSGFYSTAVAEDKSSSTEGPDSPGMSSPGSPVPPMLTSASPFHHFDNYQDVEKSNLPRYQLGFTGDVSKDGDVIFYRIRVQKLPSTSDVALDNNSRQPEEELIIERQYEDFEFLHHNLTTHNNINGIIVPPMPVRPASDPMSAEARSKKQLGSANRNMQGDDFAKDSDTLERYMNDILVHPIFGKDRIVAEFLEHRNPPIRTKIKKGFLTGMKQSLESRKGLTRDVDESFQKERDWASQYGVQIKDAGEKFQIMISAQLKLSNQIMHLATSLQASVGGNEGANAFFNRFNNRFAGCLEEEKYSLEKAVANEDKTLGSYLSLWTNYMEAENLMLLRRTCLMIEKEHANKAMLKAKPHKFDKLKTIKEEKELEFEECSKMASIEVRRFHQKRLSGMRDTLVQYTEGQIRCAKEAVDELSKCVLKLRDFPLPEVSGGGGGIGRPNAPADQ